MRATVKDNNHITRFIPVDILSNNKCALLISAVT